MEWNGRGQHGLGSLKGSFHGSRPGERRRMGASISQRAEDMGYARKEMAVKIEHAQKNIEGKEDSKSTKGKNWLDFGLEWLETGRGDMLT